MEAINAVAANAITDRRIVRSPRFPQRNLSRAICALAHIWSAISLISCSSSAIRFRSDAEYGEGAQASGHFRLELGHADVASRSENFCRSYLSLSWTELWRRSIAHTAQADHLGGQRLPAQRHRTGRRARYRLQVVRKDPGQKGFAPLPKRWAVERTFGWWALHRRLVPDYELPRYRGNSYYPEAVVIRSACGFALDGGVW
jgi:hypothetical protein